MAVLGGAATIVWVSNVFEIVAFASRAFALYYLLQAVLAAVVSRHEGDRRGRIVGFAVVAATMGFVVVAGVPVG